MLTCYLLPQVPEDRKGMDATPILNPDRITTSHFSTALHTTTSYVVCVILEILDLVRFTQFMLLKL